MMVHLERPIAGSVRRLIVAALSCIALGGCEPRSATRARWAENEARSAAYNEWQRISTDGGAALYLYRGCFWSASDTLGVKPVLNGDGSQLCRAGAAK